MTIEFAPILSEMGITNQDIKEIDFTVKKEKTKKRLTKSKVKKFLSVINIPEDMNKWGELAVECDITPYEAELLYFEVKNAKNHLRINNENK